MNSGRTFTRIHIFDLRTGFRSFLSFSFSAAFRGWDLPSGFPRSGFSWLGLFFGIITIGIFVIGSSSLPPPSPFSRSKMNSGRTLAGIPIFDLRPGFPSFFSSGFYWRFLRASVPRFRGRSLFPFLPLIFRRALLFPVSGNIRGDTCKLVLHFRAPCPEENQKKVATAKSLVIDYRTQTVQTHPQPDKAKHA